MKGYSYAILICTHGTPRDQGQMSVEDWAGWDRDGLSHLERPQSIGVVLLTELCFGY